MTFGDYWLKICSANPALPQAQKLTLSVDAYRAALQRAFSAGQLSPLVPQSSDDYAMDLFDKIFPGKR